MTTNQGGVVSSISRTGAFEPFDLQVSRGQITFHEAFCQFGINSDVQQSTETVWTGSTGYSFPASASVLKISSSSTDDGAAGTGARTVLVDGLNANYERVTEVVSLDGQTQVDTTNTYIRVNKMTVLTAGSGGTSVGNIYAGTGTAVSGVPPGVVNQTGILANETESSFYSVPAGHTLFINRWTMSSGNSTANAATRFTLRVRPLGGVFGIKAFYNIPGNGIYECESAYPLPIPEKADLDVRAIASAGTSIVSTQLQMILIQNNYEITSG